MDKVAVIGASGLVGKEVVSLLKNSKYAPQQIDSLGRQKKYTFDTYDTVFLCTPSKVSAVLAPLAALGDTCVIDLSSAHRRSDAAFLFHPTNPINSTKKIFAIPNCVASILLTVLAPLHRINPILRIFGATYQAASGAGKKGIEELTERKKPDIFPHPYEYNLFLHEKNESEEEKIIEETKLLLQSPKLKMHIRAIRVPVLRAHSMILNVTFTHPLSEKEAYKILSKENLITYSDSPTPKMAENSQSVFYGPIRQDFSLKNSLDFFICGDQLLRGAALTAVECYDLLCEKSIIKPKLSLI